MEELVEYNSYLVLYPYGTQGKSAEECLPEELEVGKIYEFLKKGYQNYEIGKAVPLFDKMHVLNMTPPRPIAAVSILTPTPILNESNEIWTSVFYGVHALLNHQELKNHFNGGEWDGEGNTLWTPSRESQTSPLQKLLI